jgi:translocation and assembly module TamA
VAGYRRAGIGRTGAALALLLGTAWASLATPPAFADIVSFDVQGGPAELGRALRAASPLLSAEREDRTDSEDLLAAAQAEYSGLLAVLYAQARYAPVISVLVDGREAATIPALDFPAQVRQIIVRVDPGPIFAFSRAQIAPLAPGTELPTGFAIGKPAETGVIREAVRTSVDGWRAVGYAKAQAGDQSLVVEHAQEALSAEIAMAPGRQLRFGQFSVTGAQRMREERIRAIAGFPEGEIFDPEKLERSATRLRRAGVFRSVALAEAETPNADGTLDVATTVIEELPRRFGFGAEVSTLDGLDASAFWMHRNLWGGAERLRFDAAVENIGAQDNGVDYRLGVTLERPATFTPDTLMTLGATVARLDDDDNTIIDLATLSFGATQFVSDRLTLRGGIEARAENVTDTTGDYEYRALAFPLAATMDARNDKFDPTQGYFLNAGLTPFVGFDETDSGARMTLDARGYQGVGAFTEAERPLVFAGRLQVGAIYGSSLERTPRDYLFYSGGADTVRGHPYQSLGVNVLSPDQTTGGTRFVAISAEVRAPITENIGIVGFYDAGSVGVTQFLDDPQGGWQSGAGIGVRYLTSFGPLRFDLAVPVTGEDDDNGVQLYVGIGQSF